MGSGSYLSILDSREGFVTVMMTRDQEQKISTHPKAPFSLAVRVPLGVSR
jgi:hypothetical protein